MNKNEAAGKAEQAKGTTKQKVGEFTGNEDLEASGTMDKAKGKAREAAGTAQRKVNEAVDEVEDDVDDLDEDRSRDVRGNTAR